MSTRTLSWGIIGTGAIARTFARALPHSRTGQLVAIGSRSLSGAENFTKEFADVTAHGSYEALLADPAVQAVYISTPHPSHAEWCIKAARAGKHILCEKPITLNYPEAMAVAEAARENGVFLMEAFMYRCHPQTAKIVELIRSGTIGEVRVIQATFSFHAGFRAESRLFNNALGGGGILDVGCYATSIARLVAGAAQGLPFLNPSQLTGFAQLHPETGVDLYAVATAQFPGGILAQLSTGVNLNQDNGLRVFGSEGQLHAPSPFLFSVSGGTSEIHLTKNGQKPETILVKTADYLYGLEADAVGDAVAQGKKESPFMPVADSLGNMLALDSWRQGAKLTYESEKVDADFPTFDRAPLNKRADVSIPRASMPGVSFPVSRLILGCDNQITMPYATAMFDDFFARGGNMFDTAYVYMGGLQERLLGRWIEQRGLRKEVAVIAKGAHTPLCRPEFLTSQLQESLSRLRTDYADVYLMHRDNPDIPVGEFVDVLNEHLKAGRIRAFGGSNWSLERLREANAYAEKKGLRKFECVSNNFSLARMVKPVWAGCISAKDAEFAAWLRETNTALLAWSSQARGFFTDRAHPDNRSDAELANSWYSDDNFQRRDRAIQLAEKKGVLPIHIALAYVLAQPFPTFALIGPRHISETVSSLQGLEVTLTPGEMSWINLETDTL